MEIAVLSKETLNYQLYMIIKGIKMQPSNNKVQEEYYISFSFVLLLC